ncbi:hypothetical protein F5Y16DRAFT_416463 [Xylariaceae sp. FL0255]|nr:hypothetical protein F5Y16DRAFT_416463 [Xylariaceae sp. FL0255]
MASIQERGDGGGVGRDGIIPIPDQLPSPKVTTKETHAPSSTEQPTSSSSASASLSSSASVPSSSAKSVFSSVDTPDPTTKNMTTSTMTMTSIFLPSMVPSSSSSAPPLISAPLGSTFVTSIVTVTGGSPGVESTPTATPSTLAPTPSAQHGLDLPVATIVAGVTGALSSIALITLAICLLQRRRISKHKSSTAITSSSPRREDKPVFDTTGMAVGVGDYDVFAEFGGRVRSQEVNLPPSRSYNDTSIHNEGWPLTQNTSSAPTITRGGYEQQHSASHPVPQHLAELESAHAKRGGSSASSSAHSNAASNNGQGMPTSDSGHLFQQQMQIPNGLIPGNPGTQWERQNQVFNSPTDNSSTPAAKTRMPPYAPYRSSANAPRGALRATLNATAEERSNNQYANSWAEL